MYVTSCIIDLDLSIIDISLPGLVALSAIRGRMLGVCDNLHLLIDLIVSLMWFKLKVGYRYFLIQPFTARDSTQSAVGLLPVYHGMSMSSVTVNVRLSVCDVEVL